MRAAVSVGALLTLASPTPAARPQDAEPRVFRGSVDLIQVDAYPTRNGKTVEGLTAADFQVFEDGKPQQVQNVEFVRADVNATSAERRDPATQEAGNAAAADGRNRAFVIYFDTYHVTLDGSSRTRGPLIGFLDRMLGPTDIFAVAAPKLRPRDLVFVRSTLTLDREVNKVWNWGVQAAGMQMITLEPEERTLAECYGWLGHDAYLEETVARRREDLVLRHLQDLVRYLGSVREARKSLVILTRGWPLYGPNEAARRAILGDQYGSLPRIGVSPGGSLSSQAAPGTTRDAWCAGEIIRLYGLDDQDRLRQLIELANRNNVTFYPVNPVGLEPPNIMSNDPAAAWQSLRLQESSFKTIAETTGGLWGFGNDLAANFRAVADDVSAYYLVSYYSTNANFDGKYRKIDVKVRQPGVNVRARPGYFGASSVSAPSATPTASSSSALAVAPALARLARLENPPGLFLDGVVSGGTLALAAEIPLGRSEGEAWATGGDLTVDVMDAAGTKLPPSTAHLAAGVRGVRLDVPITGSTGPWRVTAKAAAKNEVLDETSTISTTAAVSLGEVALYRALAPPRAPFIPAVEPLFRRTERLRLEWPATATVADRSARLLDKLGQPTPIVPAVTERPLAAGVALTVDLSLAPLSAGDYVIELTAKAADDMVRKYFAFRVVR